MRIMVMDLMLSEIEDNTRDSIASRGLFAKVFIIQHYNRCAR